MHTITIYDVVSVYYSLHANYSTYDDEYILKSLQNYVHVIVVNRHE